MSGCCDHEGYRDFFGARFSRSTARRYRRRGLDRTATRMAAFLEEQGIEGASVLEIGGGVGDLHVELLRRGAARATNLELVDSYDADAARLADEAGVGDRVTRRLVDLAADPDAVEPHDVVVLHRVVCCYPDYERLLGAAAAHAGRLLVFSHPPRNAASRLVVATQNAVLRLRRSTFRTFAHDPAAMRQVPQGAGLAPAYRHRGWTWQVAGFAAPPG